MNCHLKYPEHFFICVNYHLKYLEQFFKAAYLTSSSYFNNFFLGKIKKIYVFMCRAYAWLCVIQEVSMQSVCANISHNRLSFLILEPSFVSSIYINNARERLGASKQVIFWIIIINILKFRYLITLFFPYFRSKDRF